MKFGQQQDVRVERQNPIAAGERDGLVLRRRETGVLVVVDDPAADLELLQNVDGAVGGRVIDDDDFVAEYFCASTESRHFLIKRPLL